MGFNDTTTAQLVLNVYRKISLVSGASVQRYAQDVVLMYLQDTYDELFKKFWWDQFRHREVMTLDGTTGTVTTDLSEKIKEPDDIKAIFPEDGSKSLSTPPGYYNPDLITGTRPLFFEKIADASKLFRILPVTSTGNVTVVYRTKPAPLNIEDAAKIPFDSLVLEYGAAHKYLVDDGSNPAQEQKFQNQFASRVIALTAGHNDDPISMNPAYAGEWPTQWFSDA